jgi:hypothetical protein
VGETGGVSARASLTDDQHAEWAHAAGFPQLRQVLLWQWDPIEIADVLPYTEDEYDTYVRVLLTRLREGAGASDVAAYLLAVEVEAMGGRYSDDAKLSALGEHIVEWHRKSTDHWLAFGSG